MTSTSAVGTPNGIRQTRERRRTTARTPSRARGRSPASPTSNGSLPRSGVTDRLSACARGVCADLHRRPMLPYPDAPTRAYLREVDSAAPEERQHAQGYYSDIISRCAPTATPIAATSPLPILRTNRANPIAPPGCRTHSALPISRWCSARRHCATRPSARRQSPTSSGRATERRSAGPALPS